MRLTASILALILLTWTSDIAQAKIARGGSSGRASLGTSASRAAGSHAKPGTVQRPSGHPGTVPRTDGAKSSRTREYHGTYSQNRNVNVHRDIDVNYDCCGRGWGWGSFAAGTAAGVAAGAAIGAATTPNESSVVVVQPPPNTYVSTLPPGCTAVGTGPTVTYQCGNTYYQPSYYGTELVYQTVPQP